VAAANRYLKERFVPEYNARFAVKAAEPGSAFVPHFGRPIEDVLCVQEDQMVGVDNCLSGSDAACRFRRSAIASTVCGLPCGCTNIPTAASLFSMALPASMRRDAPTM
jgi:hypothetical protein